MTMNTYVNFPGTCAEAFCFYEKHLGAKPGMMITNGQLPDQSRVSPEWKDAVLHARISLADTELMDADIPSAQPMRSAHLMLRVDSDAEAERIFSALSEGGDVLMPMEKTFFASRFGQDSPKDPYSGLTASAACIRPLLSIVASVVEASVFLKSQLRQGSRNALVTE